MKKTIKKKISSLYIHVPFCSKICPYCDFVKLIKNDNFIEQYIKELTKDLLSVENKFKKFKSIYIGGGTPSILSCDHLKTILMIIKRIRRKNAEITIECNPEDITIEKLKLLKKYGINRISIGIQSFDQNILKEINRDYKIDYFSLIKLVKQYIKNINVDLIYGFKNQSFNDLKNDLNNFIRLDISHLSIYSLIVDKNSIFYNQGYKEQNEDDSRIFYDYIVSFLRKNGFERYEISNFAKNKKYSKHNLNYWKNSNYLAIGIGASGYIDDTRYRISPSFNLYINGKREIEKEDINSSLKKEYFFITNLRLEKGFKIKEYNKIFKSNFLNEFKNIIDDLSKEGLVKIKKGYFSCTDEGLAILDRILLKFI